jgi:lysophospholipid acyltransferase (LPLAT)-like uncharacterized protein
MKIKSPLANKTVGLLSYTAIRSWMGTLDFKGYQHEASVDPADRSNAERGIYVFWHEYMPLLMYLRGNCDLAMLMSRHRDADVLSRLSLHFGFGFVRGSTQRGGQAALRKLMRKSQTHHLTITPDGPRGPRRQLAAGCIYLASKLNMPLVAFGLGYDRPWRLNTWDRFAVPRPMSRARVIASPYIRIPPDLDRAGIESHRTRVERLMCDLTDEAEAWAETGTPKQGQIPLAPKARPLPTPCLDLLAEQFHPNIDRKPPAASSLRRAA